MNRSKTLLVMALAVAQGCATEPLFPPPMAVPQRAEAAAAAEAATTDPGATRVTPTPKPPPPEPPRAPAQAQAPKPAVAEEANIALAFDQIALPTLVQIIYGKTLNRNVVLDPAVAARRDLVTLRSGERQTPSQVDAAMRLLLRSYGINVIDQGDLVRVVPDTASTGMLPEIRRGRALPETPASLRPVFHLEEMRAVRNTDVSQWIRGMFEKRVDVREDSTRNAVLLIGTSDDVAAALEAVRVLDQPLMRGRHGARITPVYWSVDELARRLAEILQAEGYGAGTSTGAPPNAVVLLPIPGANAIFAFASDEKVLRHVEEWARELDKPNERGGGRSLFHYKVLHTDAESLAKTLQQVITGAPAAPPAPPAPGAAPAPAPAARAGIIVDKATNTIIFQGRSEDYGDMLNLLRALDKPAKSALIEVIVAEVRITDDSAIGIEWLAREAGLSHGRSATFGTLGGLALGSTGFNFRLFSDTGELRMVLNALATSNNARILSKPSVLARNGDTATIQVGQEVPIVTSQQVATGTTGVIIPTPTTTTIPQSIQYKTTGVILNVRPVIYAGDRIDLEVSQEVSSAESTTTGVSTSPTFTTRKVQTRLSLKSGGMALLGGLISSTRSDGRTGIPFLKDIPLLGQAFRRDSDRNDRTELIVVITPWVISSEEDSQAILDAFKGQLGSWARDLTGPAKSRERAPARE